MFSLKVKNIVVTGASSGIGREIAICCNKQGANVLLIARDKIRLKETLSKFDSVENSYIHHMDLMDLNNLESLKVLLLKMGANSGFVHAAGVSPTLPFKNIKNKDFQEAFNLNVWAGIELSQLILKPDIRDKDLSMVFISSVMSVTGEKSKSIYAMTKSALIGLVKSCALEYANKAIRFNAISPSVIETPFSLKSEYKKDSIAMTEIENKHPLGIGSTNDVAAGAIYLLANESRWVTGTNLIIDGGYLAI